MQKGGGQNEAAPWVHEYSDRQRLKDLGYWSPLSELSCFKAEVFCLIAATIDEVNAKKKK